ncbi:YpbS family protein [Neobacillus jeddahensis]|uniref:YpbS family protein n=1 Tax=Neobacillus jeddahensis TaxID=1461580 RepID=UPI00058F35CD|nr:YpbS family protein [Neobacillus jeddahensis]
MSVHKAITQHVNKQNKQIATFLLLDQQREFYIEEALKCCKEGKPFTTEKINEITEQINALTRQGIVPNRKLVSIDMVKAYAKKS